MKKQLITIGAILLVTSMGAEAGHNGLLAFPQVARRVEAFLGDLVSAGARLD